MNNLIVCLCNGSQSSDPKQKLLRFFNAGGDDEIGRIQVSPQRYTEAIYCKQGPSAWAPGTFARISKAETSPFRYRDGDQIPQSSDMPQTQGHSPASNHLGDEARTRPTSPKDSPVGAYGDDGMMNPGPCAEDLGKVGQRSTHGFHPLLPFLLPHLRLSYRTNTH